MLKYIDQTFRYVCDFRLIIRLLKWMWVHMWCVICWLQYKGGCDNQSGNAGPSTFSDKTKVPAARASEEVSRCKTKNTVDKFR